MIDINKVKYPKSEWLQKVSKASDIELRMEQTHLREVIRSLNIDPYEYIEDSRVKHPFVVSWEEKQSSRPNRDDWLAVDFTGFYQDGASVFAGAYKRFRKDAIQINETQKQYAQARIDFIDQVIADRILVSSIL